MSSTDDSTAPEPDIAAEDEQPDTKRDTADDPAHRPDEDEGWTSEGGATPSGPATDVGS